MPRTLDRLLPSATAWISTTAVHPCYTPSNDTSADEVTLIAAHFHDSDKNSDVLVHDMAFSYPRWVLKDASHLFATRLTPEVKSQVIEETADDLELLLSFLDYSSGKNDLTQLHFSLDQLWTLFQLVNRYALNPGYRALFRTILNTQGPVRGDDGKVKRGWAGLLDDPADAELAAKVFKLRIMAHDMKASMLWTNLLSQRVYGHNLLSVPSSILECVLPEYSDVLLGVLTVVKFVSDFRHNPESQYQLVVDYTENQTMFLYHFAGYVIQVLQYF